MVCSQDQRAVGWRVFDIQETLVAAILSVVSFLFLYKALKNCSQHLQHIGIPSNAKLILLEHMGGEYFYNSYYCFLLSLDLLLEVTGNCLASHSPFTCKRFVQ